MTYFTKESLEKFQEMCAEGIDFGEEPVYDFAMCLEPDGDVYGIEPGEKCKVGKPISDSAGAKAKAAKTESNSSGARMAKLKAAYLKKTGRKMSPKEMNAARLMIEKKRSEDKKEGKKESKK